MPPTPLLFGPDLPLDHRLGTFIVRTRWLPDGVRANERHVDAGVRYECDIDLRVREAAWGQLGTRSPLDASSLSI